mmetsp:Transcript_22513/g.51921  ORF Transcript_22513/g.51921 Transcript_22513/m.51921 type:complete len:164 (-) Transcript_22513:5286-5777(-)
MDLITPDFGLIFWQTVTLLVVLLILSKFAWRPILNTIQNREESIEEALQAAEEAKRMMVQVQKDKDTLLTTAQAERARIIEEAMRAQRSIIEEAKIVADNERKEMMQQARVLLEKEKEAARGVLKNEMATLAVQIAEKLLQSELQQHTQEKLVQRLIQEAHGG